ncbi:transposase family protein [Pseudonocardia sp. ICBG601]|uniref:transposase family protein n=1 Tax=Pseudonocardia sp. ICBG601 TaxID=2846759 RepID=UPI0035AB77C2
MRTWSSSRSAGHTAAGRHQRRAARLSALAMGCARRRGVDRGLPGSARLCPDQPTVNMLHSATRAIAERGNALLKNTFRALRHLSLCPQRIGAITAAALVLLHTEHNRTT